MDNSPRHRRAMAQRTGGYVGMMVYEFAAQMEVIRELRRRANSPVEGKRANMLRAAIRRLKFKKEQDT